MPEFLELTPSEDALNSFLSKVFFNPLSESIESKIALGRVLYEPITAPHPIPSFRRSTVDGYALQAVDTHGASSGLPAYLKLVGEINMGEEPNINLSRGESALIHTGGMIPNGADAVIMIENTQQVDENEIEILKPVSANENVIQIGEDANQGEEILKPGKLLTPADIGSLMAFGITSIKVAKKPLIGIISTGDEIISPEQDIQMGQVRDVNSYTLQSLILKLGGTPKLYGIVLDNFDNLFEIAKIAHEECDVVIITAGSSASARDITYKIINKLGKPGVLVHGINIRPGKPTILAICDDKPVIGLPGNPMSALVIAQIFITPLINKMLKIIPDITNLPAKAVLTINLSSQSGREDWIPVKLILDNGNIQAEPIFGKSNLITKLSTADGLAKIPADATGINAGEVIEVFFLKS